MINQFEVPAYLADELPEIREELKSVLPTFSVIKSIQCLSDYTRRKVMQHNLRLVRKCFAVAETMYVNGNTMVRDAIENVFIYSFSSILNMNSKEENRKIQALIPLCLHTAYVQQILKSGI